MDYIITVQTQPHHSQNIYADLIPIFTRLSNILLLQRMLTDSSGDTLRISIIEVLADNRQVKKLPWSDIPLSLQHSILQSQS